MHGDEENADRNLLFYSSYVHNAVHEFSPSEDTFSAGQETKPKGITALCADLTKLTKQYAMLDGMAELCEAETELKRHKLYNAICRLEDAIGFEAPRNALEALSLTLICAYRMDCAFASNSGGGHSEESRGDEAAARRMLKALMSSLEKMAGVSQAQLGLDWYLSRPEK